MKGVNCFLLSISCILLIVACEKEQDKGIKRTYWECKSTYESNDTTFIVSQGYQFNESDFYYDSVTYTEDESTKAKIKKERGSYFYDPPIVLFQSTDQDGELFEYKGFISESGDTMYILKTPTYELFIKHQ